MNQETSSLLEDYMPCGMEESTLHRKDTTALEKKVRQKSVHDRAVHVSVKQIETEQELKDVLAMCYDILGADNSGLYGYDAWYQRFLDGRQPLVFAEKDGKPVSAVLGRAENEESLVIGFTACREEYRKQGNYSDKQKE